jgi:hypothetical protein
VTFVVPVSTPAELTVPESATLHRYVGRVLPLFDVLLGSLAGCPYHSRAPEELVVMVAVDVMVPLRLVLPSFRCARR